MTKEEKAIYNKKYYQAHKQEIVMRAKRYQQEHKEEKMIYMEQYRQDNKEKLVAWGKQYWQINKEKIAIRAKRYRRIHKKEIVASQKQYRQKHKTEIAICKKQYNQTEKGKSEHCKASHKRRTLEKNAKYENFDPNEVLRRDGYICQACGKKTRPDFKNQFHPLYPNLDHIVPLSLGGSHTRQNTQCLCRHCNIVKHNTGDGDQLRMFG